MARTGIPPADADVSGPVPTEGTHG
jgi:hypothetical protein